MNSSNKIKKLTMIAMMCAFAYVIMLVARIPVVLFLKYEPKDVIITIGGFIFGPFTSFLISIVVAFIEMITVSETGIIGFIMNVLSTCCFACTAAYFYKKKHTISGAVLGLVIGIFITTGVMLLWNYFIAPFYMGYPREAIAELLLPAFLPFNLLKGGLNTALTLLLYKPIVGALRKSNMIAFSSAPTQTLNKGKRIGVTLIAILLLITCILFVLILRGVL